MDTNNPKQINSILSKIDTLVKGGAIGDNDSIASYVEKLIEEKKFPDLTSEVREEIKKDLLRRLDDFITSRIIAGLSDEDVKLFESMLKDGKPEAEIQKFVSEHIPDFVNFLTNVLLEFRGVYLGLINTPVMPGKEPEVLTTIKTSDLLKTPPPAPAPKVN